MSLLIRIRAGGKLVIRYLSALIPIIVFFSCTTGLEKPESNSIELIEIDKAFSRMSETYGMDTAFIYYSAEEVIKMEIDRHPIIGKSKIIESFRNTKSNLYELTWEPLKCDLSGNLGYTFGNYFLSYKTSSGQDTTLYGNYVTIWKRQDDGSWKFVLDGGNPTPEPSTLEQ